MSLARELFFVLVGSVLVLGAAHALAQAARPSNPATVRSCKSAVIYTARWFPKAQLKCLVRNGRYEVRLLVCEGVYCRSGQLVAGFEVVP